MYDQLSSGDYPALYTAADEAAINAQRKYLFLMKVYIWLLIAGATLTVYADNTEWFALAAVVVFLGSIGLAILQAFRRFDSVWYNGRAVAESVKTRAWRYMMRAEPYEAAKQPVEVDREFCDDLGMILEQNRTLAQYLEVPKGEAISSRMAAIRQLDLEDRISVYRTARIDEQRTWYGKKSRGAKRLERNWFATMVALHGIAIVLLLVQVAEPRATWLPTEVVIVAAASALTWMQVKRYQDNRSAYSLAGHEITIIREQSGRVRSEQELSDFVKDAENAFSREHIQWVARRDR